MNIKITKNGRRLLYVGIGAYIVFLLATLPASFLTRYILPSVKSANAIKLQSVHGSVWQGRAMDASINRFSLGRLDWKLNGWGLLLGDVDLKLKFKNENSRGSGFVSMGFGGSTVAEDIEVQFPSEALQPLLYGIPISFSGDLRGSIKLLEIKPGKVLRSTGRVVWQSAALRAPQNIELGSFLITLEPINNGTKLKITDQQQGPVISDIGITVKGDGEYRLNGWLKARDERQQHITEALRLIGRSDSTGKFWMSFSGKLRGW